MKFSSKIINLVFLTTKIRYKSNIILLKCLEGLKEGSRNLPLFFGSFFQKNNDKFTNAKISSYYANNDS